MSEAPERTLLVVSGPTGSGKSGLSIEIAQKLDAEIVSADSVAVYRGFDVGAAKPSPEELESVPHHLISILPPEEDFDAGIFSRMAGERIRDVWNRGRNVIVTGGTGLYITALLSGLVETEAVPSEVSQTIREKEHAFRASGALEEEEVREQMHAWLADVDALAARRLHPQDLHRVRRALVVCLSGSGALSLLQDEHDFRSSCYQALVVVLLKERVKLYQRLNLRVEQMLEQGLLEEVERLRNQHPRSCRAFGSIGYRHMLNYLEGEWSFEEAVRLMKRDTRRYAKRQLTWWRNQPARLGWQELKTDARALVEQLPEKLLETEQVEPSVCWLSARVA